MKVHIFYWFGKDISHFRSKDRKRHSANGGYGVTIPVMPSSPNLPDHDSDADLTAEQIVALSKDFDVQIKDRDENGVTLNLDRKYGGHRQR